MEAKKITIARFSRAVDDFTTPDRIDFNLATADDFKRWDRVGNYLNHLEISDVEGIGNNQAAEKPLGNIQALGVIEEIYTLRGWITVPNGNANSGNNIGLIRLNSWKNEPQVIKTIWEAGRFGILDANDSTNTITPIGTGTFSVGLIFQSYKKEYNFIKNRVEFTLIFKKSRGPDS